MHPSEGRSQPDLLMQNESEKIKARVHVPQAIQFCLCLACSVTSVTSKQQPGWLVRSASPYQPYTFTVSATLAPLLSLLTPPPQTPPCSLLHLAVKLRTMAARDFFLVEGEGKILSSVALQFPGCLSPVLHHSRLNSPASHRTFTAEQSHSPWACFGPLKHPAVLELTGTSAFCQDSPAQKTLPG